MTAGAATIEMRGLAVTYRKGPAWRRILVPAVKHVDLAIAGGETLGLVGGSGSGKTTLGRVMLGLVRPTSGTFLFEGRPFEVRLRKQGALSVVFQHPEWALNPRLRCGSSIAEPLRIQGVSRSVCREKVDGMLAEVGLDAELAGRFPGELSGGQRQRMAIARSLITRPRFIVFDEAVSALDVSVQSQVLNLIRTLRERQLGVVIISHNLADVFDVADRIIVLRLGGRVATFDVHGVSAEDVVAAITGAEFGAAPDELEEPS